MIHWILLILMASGFIAIAYGASLFSIAAGWIVGGIEVIVLTVFACVVRFWDWEL